MRYNPQALVVFFAVLGACLCSQARAEGTNVILDETAWLRHYLRFGVNRYSLAALKADGEKVLSKPGLDKLKRDTERLLEQRGKNPSQLDWMEHVTQPMWANFSPPSAATPPEDWAAAEFDDSAWVLRRGPFQSSRPVDITQANLGQFDESMDLGLLHAFYRARFVVEEPARTNLSFGAAYHGGLRVLLNGQEIGRGHLPAGKLDADACGEDYPQKAYDAAGADLRPRTIGPLAVPAGLLRKGTNVLAVEVHASRFHPVVLTNPRQANWGGPTRPWPHARLCSLQLCCPTGAVKSCLGRPAGLQVWVADMNSRVRSDDYLPPGELPGTLRLVGARNGTFSGQVVIGTDKPLTELRAAPSELHHVALPQSPSPPREGVGGGGVLPASAFSVSYLVPFPEDQWTLKRLGDERGLDATFPDAKTLEAFDAMQDSAKVCLFDQLSPDCPQTVPANTSRPVWVSLRVPADAAADRYQGSVKIAAQGAAAVDIPLELTVADWALPSPSDFRACVGCEENPYGVAKQYGVKPWSEQHFALLESSLAQLGRIGNKWVNVPVLVQTEYGNRCDSMIQWIRGKDQRWAFDYKVLDRYLDLHIKHCGPPRVINVVVMQGMKGQLKPPAPGQIKFLDEATGQTALLPLSTESRPPQSVAAWKAFALALLEHLKTKGLAKSVYWGHPLEAEADPELKNVLLEAVPEVAWIAGPHEMMFNGTFAKNEKFYKVVETIRYWGNWPSFRVDEGWRSKTLHLLNPRVGGTVFALHTTSMPFAYRVMPDHALAFGRSGFTRVGADEWAAVHFDGAAMAKWQTGIPVLFTLWPGKAGAQSSARFEALLEGIQETEARIFLEQSLQSGGLPQALAEKARKMLADNLQETMFFQGNSMMHAFEEYHFRWQQRSARLYETAAEVAKAVKK